MKRRMISLVAAASVTTAAAGVAHAAWPFTDKTLRTEGGSLDPELPPPAEHKLTTGRLRGVPLTKFRTYVERVAGTYAGGVYFSTGGCHVDTGLLVERRNGNGFVSASYNDDAYVGTKLAMLYVPAVAGDTLKVYTFSQQRQVDWDCPLQRFPAVNGGWTWEVVQTGAAGGELIDVGATQGGEFIQLETATGGQGACADVSGGTCRLNDATEAVLFSVGAASLVPGATVTSTTPIFTSSPRWLWRCAANPTGYCVGGDARIPAYGTFGAGPQDANGRNFLLVGKANVPTTTTPTRPDQVEVHADLVKPTLGAQTIPIAFGDETYGAVERGKPYWPGYWEAAFAADAGRLTIEVSLKTRSPLGTFAHVMSNTTFSQWCGPGRSQAVHGCKTIPGGWFAFPRNPAPLNAAEPGDSNGVDEDDYRWFRGQLQQHGARVRVLRECQSGSLLSVEEVASRDIPLGAFGAYDVFQSFYVTVDNAWGAGHAPGQCRDQSRSWNGRLRVTIEGARDTAVAGTLTSIVTSRDAVRVARNVDLASFKAAQLNMLYATDHNPAFSPSEPNLADKIDRRARNAANLLAVRGRAVPSARTVDDPATRGPFEWDADLVTMTEVDECGQRNSFASEVAATGSSTWFHNCSINEARTLAGFGYSSNGVIFARDNLDPGCNGASCGGGLSTGPWFRDDVGQAVCTGSWLGGEEACTLEDDGFGSNSVLPARIRVNGEPIAVFSPHLRDDSVTVRWPELESMIRRMRAFMQRDAASFNIDGVDDPRHAKNRMIIVGDFNTANHTRGEIYWMLGRLRQEFGFAVDVSLAVPGAVDNATGMHVAAATSGEGRPLACLDQGRSCTTGTGGLPYASWHQASFMSANTWVYGYDKREAVAWQSPMTVPNWPLGASNRYPYWAATFRGDRQDPGYRTDRYDVYLLVGKGWLADDAVQDYAVMQDTGGETTPYAGAANITPFHNYYELPDGRRIPVGVEMWGTSDLAQEATAGGVENASPMYPSYTPYRAIYGATTPSGGADGGKPALKTDHRPIGARLQVRRNANRDWNTGTGTDPYTFQWTTPN